MSIRLFPAEPDFTLYESGFEEDDIFVRRHVGHKLSQLVEKVSDPLVIAVDGPWGIGKSHFLKRWVGAHEGEATTVYFDAFAHDFLDDPLIAITSAVNRRITPAERETTSWKKVRTNAAKLAQPLAGVALKVAKTVGRGLAAAATAGTSEIIVSASEALYDSATEKVEEAVDEFWTREDGRRDAMTAFAEALSSFTKGATEGEERKLVIVVDELDRCRPDYALTVLEVIKHFFNAPNVHFVLGINRIALESSIRARYGSDFDAAHYLHRFINLTLTLPDSNQNMPNGFLRAYLNKHIRGLDLGWNQFDVGIEIFSLIAAQDMKSLRSAQRYISNIALATISGTFSRLNTGYTSAALSAIAIKSTNLSLYNRILHKTSTFSELSEYFGLSVKPEEHAPGMTIHLYEALAYLSDEDIWRDSNHKNEVARLFGGYGHITGAEHFRQIIETYVDSYSL